MSNNIDLTPKNVTTFFQRANEYLNEMHDGLWKYLEAKQKKNRHAQKILIYRIHQASNNIKSELSNIDNMIPMFLFPTEPKVTNFFDPVNRNVTRKRKRSNNIIPFANYKPRNVSKETTMLNFLKNSRKQNHNNGI